MALVESPRIDGTVYAPHTVDATFEDGRVPAATTTVLVATALLALILGSVGVYAVLSFLVSRRTQEFTIRVALGALPRDVRWLVVREGAALAAAGLTAGVATIGVVTLLACLVPTRRAMRVDPLLVLRSSWWTVTVCQDCLTGAAVTSAGAAGSAARPAGSSSTLHRTTGSGDRWFRGGSRRRRSSWPCRTSGS